MSSFCHEIGGVKWSLVFYSFKQLADSEFVAVCSRAVGRFSLFLYLEHHGID